MTQNGVEDVRRMIEETRNALQCVNDQRDELTKKLSDLIAQERQLIRPINHPVGIILSKMEVHQSEVVVLTKPDSAKSYISKWGRQHHQTFTTRVIPGVGLIIRRIV